MVELGPGSKTVFEPLRMYGFSTTIYGFRRFDVHPNDMYFVYHNIKDSDAHARLSTPANMCEKYEGHLESS